MFRKKIVLHYSECLSLPMYYFLIEYHKWVNYNNISGCGLQFQRLGISRPWHCLGLPCKTISCWKTKKHTNVLDICPLSLNGLSRQWMWSLHKGGTSVTEPFLKSFPCLGVVSTTVKIHHEFVEGIQTIEDPKYNHMCSYKRDPYHRQKSKADIESVSAL